MYSDSLCCCKSMLLTYLVCVELKRMHTYNFNFLTRKFVVFYTVSQFYLNKFPLGFFPIHIKIHPMKTDENEAAHTSNYTLYEEDVGLANWPNMVLAPVKDYEPPWERVTDTDVPPLHRNAVADSADTNVSPFKMNEAASSAGDSVPHFYRNAVASSAGDSVPHFYRNAVASSGGGSVPHFYRNAAASSAGDCVTHFNKNAVASSGGDIDPNISRNPNKMPLARKRYQEFMHCNI